jgi:hypothetical protein
MQVRRGRPDAVEWPCAVFLDRLEVVARVAVDQLCARRVLGVGGVLADDLVGNQLDPGAERLGLRAELNLAGREVDRLARIRADRIAGTKVW